MALNLQVEQALNVADSQVKDQDGNNSPLVLTSDRVGIGTRQGLLLEQDANTVLMLQRRVTGANQSVSFIVDPAERVFILDVGGSENSRARIHLGDASFPDNSVTMLGNAGIGTTTPEGKLHIDETGPPFSDSLLRVSSIATDNLLLNLIGDSDRTLGGPFQVVVTERGAVGIGTTTPTEKLEVQGNILATGDVILAGADCAEDFDMEEGQALEPGMVMVISDEAKLGQCTKAYDKRVAGVLSGAGDFRPGIILGRQEAQGERMPLALTGKVFCKVDAQYSPVGVGDLLTTSPTPGHAMKAVDPLRAFGAVIGKALRPLKSGQDLIPILIALQ